jgi:hypothetical protein
MVLLILGAAERAAADPYVLQPPSAIGLDFEGYGFRFVGEGFDIAHHPMSVGVFFPLVRNPSCDPCAVGQIYDPSFRTSGETFLGNGRGTVAGTSCTSYSDIAFFGTLNLDAVAVTFPSVPGDGFRLQTPFSFNAVIRGMVGGEQAFMLSLVGGGRALRFFDFDSESGLYWAGENQPQFFFDDTPGEAPVPEPGTLLLFATGTAIAGTIKRRRSQSATPESNPM